MNIGLIQLDGSLPNLALMQIATYHERRGDSVEMCEPVFSYGYDMVYASKIFKFTATPALPPQAMIGGTGIDFTNTLPVEIAECPPSWSIYPKFDKHLGFSMKGCRFACKFCCVPQKEGRPKANSTIDDLLTNPNGGNRLILMDNDFFGGVDWKINLERIIELKLRVCFVQGLNIRIITDEQAELLALCNFQSADFTHKYLTFAWDRFRDGERVFAGIDRCERAGIEPKRMQFFVLIGYDTTPEQDYERVMRLRDRGCMPYVMPYNKFDEYQKRFARWVNHRAVFNTVSWENYGKKQNDQDKDLGSLFN